MGELASLRGGPKGRHHQDPQVQPPTPRNPWASLPRSWGAEGKETLVRLEARLRAPTRGAPQGAVAAAAEEPNQGGSSGSRSSRSSQSRVQRPRAAILDSGSLGARAALAVPEEAADPRSSTTVRRAETEGAQERRGPRRSAQHSGAGQCQASGPSGPRDVGRHSAQPPQPRPGDAPGGRRRCEAPGLPGHLATPAAQQVGTAGGQTRTTQSATTTPMGEAKTRPITPAPPRPWSPPLPAPPGGLNSFFRSPMYFFRNF